MYKIRQANFSMEYLAVQELKKYENGRYSTGEPCAVPIEEIIEKQYDISIEYHYLRKNLSNLGQMVFEGGHVPIYDMEKKCYTLIDVPAKTMVIDIRLLQDKRFANRLRFTYAHELAHFLIHKEHFVHSEQSPALLAGEEEEYDDVIEKQANMFCSYFLIPTGQMKKVYNRLMAKGCSQNIVKEMAVILVNIFSVTSSFPTESRASYRKNCLTECRSAEKQIKKLRQDTKPKKNICFPQNCFAESANV